MIETNGVRLSVVDEGAPDAPVVVLCHGFPELAYSWRHQVPALVGAGWRVLAPDMRGYGGSDAPAAIGAYAIDVLAADVVGLLDAVGAEQGVLVGHDLGAPVVWHAALAHPGRVRAVVALSAPHSAPAPVGPPLALMRAAVGAEHVHYVDHFQEPGVAEADFEADVARMWLAFVWSICGDCPRDQRFRGPWAVGETFPDVLSDPPAGAPPWLTVDDVMTYVSEFERTGLRGGLSWYRNMDRNWDIARRLPSHVVQQPALFVTGSRDPARNPPAIERLADVCADLRGVHVLDGCGHWTQQERPDEVSALLVHFARSL